MEELLDGCSLLDLSDSLMKQEREVFSVRYVSRCYKQEELLDKLHCIAEISILSVKLRVELFLRVSF
jgi:hypothetical protein